MSYRRSEHSNIGTFAKRKLGKPPFGTLEIGSSLVEDRLFVYRGRWATAVTIGIEFLSRLLAVPLGIGAG